MKFEKFFNFKILSIIAIDIAAIAVTFSSFTFSWIVNNNNNKSPIVIESGDLKVDSITTELYYFKYPYFPGSTNINYEGEEKFLVVVFSLRLIRTILLIYTILFLLLSEKSLLKRLKLMLF